MNIGDVLALLVETARLHGLAVLPAELEDMADLDAARDLASVAVAARGSGRRPRRCGCRRRADSGRSRPQLTPVKCSSFSFAPQTKSARCARGVIGVHAALEADRADRARVACRSPRGPARRSPCAAGRDARQPVRLDRIELVIAAQHQRHDLAVSAVDDQGLHAALRARSRGMRRAPRWCARSGSPPWRSGCARGRPRRRAAAKPPRSRGWRRNRPPSENTIASSPESASTWNSCETSRRCCRRRPARRGS